MDIYATSIDYDPNTDMSRDFFATVQNKMHWAAHGQTAAEVFYGRANSNKPNMGLTNWLGDSVLVYKLTDRENSTCPRIILD